MSAATRSASALAPPALVATALTHRRAAAVIRGGRLAVGAGDDDGAPAHLELALIENRGLCGDQTADHRPGRRDCDPRRPRASAPAARPGARGYPGQFTGDRARRLSPGAAGRPRWIQGDRARRLSPGAA